MTGSSLLERFGSPSYVYELETLRSAHRDLVGALPEGTRLLYSVKANPHPRLIAELHQLGCGVEVSSIGELACALDAGVPPQRCVHNGPAKTRGELDHAVRSGVRLYSVDSPGQLHRLAAAARQHGRPVDVMLRVNGDSATTGSGLMMTGTASQFGVDAGAIAARPQDFAGDDFARVVGLHWYPATNVPTEEGLLATFAAALAVTATLRDSLPGPLEVLDLGGGFAAPYAREGHRPDYPRLREALGAMLDQRVPGWRSGHPQVLFESGRYLTAECGRLLATVQDVKRSKGRKFVLLDSGIHHLGGMSGLRRVPPLTPHLVASGQRRAAPAEVDGDAETDVVGPLCTPLDAWARRAKLPPLRPDDVVEVPNVGAYGLTGSLIGFLSHHPPTEVVTDANRPVHVSRLSLDRTVTSQEPPDAQDH